VKAIPSIFLLAMAGVAGAFAHHLTDSGRPEAVKKPGISESVPAGASATPLPRHDGKQRTGEILAAWENDDWQAFDQNMAGMKPEDFPPLAREIILQKKSLEEVMEYWAAADAKGLLAFAMQEGSGLDLRSVVAHCFPYAPDAVFDFIRRVDGDPKVVKELVSSALGDGKEMDPAAIMAGAVKAGIFKGSDEIYAFGRVISRWAEKDTAAAFAFAKTHPAYWKFAFSGWSHRDLDAALTWVRGEGEPLVDPEMIERVVRFRAESHPEDAGRVEPFARDKNAFYESLATGMSQKPVTEIAQWLKTVPEDQRKTAYGVLCDRLEAKTAGQGVAFSMMFPELASPEDAGRALVDWSKSDPVAAIQSFQSGKLPAAVSDQVLPELVDSWMVVDREAALAFVKTLPPGETLGRIMITASRILGDGDRESALEYAQSLPDVATRIGACRLIRERMFYGDNGEKDAAAWMATIPDVAVRKALETPPPAHEQPPAEVPAPSGGDPFSAPQQVKPEGSLANPADPFAPPESGAAGQK
jgi:hypothetical protein